MDHFAIWSFERFSDFLGTESPLVELNRGLAVRDDKPRRYNPQVLRDRFCVLVFIARHSVLHQ